MFAAFSDYCSRSLCIVFVDVICFIYFDCLESHCMLGNVLTSLQHLSRRAVNLNDIATCGFSKRRCLLVT